MRKRTILAVLVLSFLLGFSPVSADPADPVIQRGIDVFTTLADGKTFYDFAYDPIPAGFFCKSSKPFRGRVAFKGLLTAPEFRRKFDRLAADFRRAELLSKALANGKGS